MLLYPMPNLRKSPGITGNFGNASNPFMRSLNDYENFEQSLEILGKLRYCPKWF